MSNWKQRENFLVNVARRHLRGHKTFDLCRSHLVKASQISKGTVYNHFASEADLMVAVATAEYQDFLAQAHDDSRGFEDPLWAFLYHHCRRLSDIINNQRFVIARIMPNPDILAQASPENQLAYQQAYRAYEAWNRNQVEAMGEVTGFDRLELVTNFIRGTMINIDDAETCCDDATVYHQYCYAMTQLLGHSHRRIPEARELKAWFVEVRQVA
ncbi:TetR/AcrR family transcriptional regulator [Ferrimonas aestuarii]|uniref:TetR/AcrR family transcriptional regulator n=1 Tax=Ferrimonas aestuarii TaxID=2569539 RepID=A0A4U1BT15_9GAMM|nr:TetR/AcrR family transcriptional regulator [Ferrimonas aestuarii]TKB58312.1 TetR/AcrR family transcriptional regulator [Ferrimonas aestuarii]